MNLYAQVANTPFSTSNATASNASYTVPLPTDSVYGISAAALQYAATVANLNLRRAPAPRPDVRALFPARMCAAAACAPTAAAVAARRAAVSGRRLLLHG